MIYLKSGVILILISSCVQSFGSKSDLNTGVDDQTIGLPNGHSTTQVKQNDHNEESFTDLSKRRLSTHKLKENLTNFIKFLKSLESNLTKDSTHSDYIVELGKQVNKILTHVRRCQLNPIIQNGTVTTKQPGPALKDNKSAFLIEDEIRNDAENILKTNNERQTTLISHIKAFKRVNTIKTIKRRTMQNVQGNLMFSDAINQKYFTQHKRMIHMKTSNQQNVGIGNNNGKTTSITKSKMNQLKKNPFTGCGKELFMLLRGYRKYGSKCFQIRTRGNKTVKNLRARARASSLLLKWWLPDYTTLRFG